MQSFRSLGEEALKLMFANEIKKTKVIPKNFVRGALERARKLSPQYFIFNNQWKLFMKEVSKDKKFKEYLDGKWL